MNDKQKHIAGLILQAMRETQDILETSDDWFVVSDMTALTQQLAQAFSTVTSAQPRKQVK